MIEGVMNRVLDSGVPALRSGAFSIVAVVAVMVQNTAAAANVAVEFVGKTFPPPVNNVTIPTLALAQVHSGAHAPTGNAAVEDGSNLTPGVIVGFALAGVGVVVVGAVAIKRCLGGGNNHVRGGAPAAADDQLLAVVASHDDGAVPLPSKFGTFD